MSPSQEDRLYNEIIAAKLAAQEASLEARAARGEASETKEALRRHIEDEDTKIKSLHDIFVQAKGAAKFVTGVVAMLAALGGALSWLKANTPLLK